jgi:hypothetical protein
MILHLQWGYIPRNPLYVKNTAIQLGCQLLTPVILATYEAKIRRIAVGGQLGQIVCETPPQK